MVQNIDTHLATSSWNAIQDHSIIAHSFSSNANPFFYLSPSNFEASSIDQDIAHLFLAPLFISVNIF